MRAFGAGSELHSLRGWAACFIACWNKIGRVCGINSPSMAALFDIDVICGNMTANRRYEMTSWRRKKFSERECEGQEFLSVRVTTLGYGGNGE